MIAQRPHDPDAETLAAFAEGRIEASRIPSLLAHLDGCQECLNALQRANEMISSETGAGGRTGVAPYAPLPARTWWAVAAAIAAVAVLSLVLLQSWRSPIAKLVAASPRTARVVEPRLSGGFPWAAYRGPLRESEEAANPAHLRLAGAAADAIERGNGDRSAGAQHAAGVALVLIESPLEAITRLRAAAGLAGNDAKIRSDLAAAEYAAALRLGRASYFPDALGDADHALRIDARLPEARFNRALALERLGLRDEARKAWQAYLDVDASSPWAVEARAHLAQLAVTNDAELFERERPQLERAAAGGDLSTVVAIVDRHRERARTFGEVEYLGRWAEAVQRNDAAGAARWLAVSRAIGDALVRLSGERLLHDAVTAIDGSRPALAEAHALYRRGRIAYARQQPGAAEPDLRRAAQLFAAAGDPMALVARWYAANTRFDRRQLAGAREEIEALAGEVRARPHYLALHGGVLWELALCRNAEGDVTGALAALDAAAARFRLLGEQSNLAAIENLRAAELDVLGRPDDAWSARIAALGGESRQRSNDRLARDLTTATAALLHARREEAARSLLTIEESVDRSLGSSGLLVHALAREAQLDAVLNEHDAAIAAANEAREVAGHLTDVTLREREGAVADLAGGAAVLRRDPVRARVLLSAAIDHLAAVALWPQVADAALLRARAAALLGDSSGEARDLDAGMAALDHYRVPLGASEAPGVFDAGTELFDEALRLHLRRGDVARAFAVVERSRGGGGLELRTLQERLAGSATVVLESFASQSDVFTFAISDRRVVVTKHPLPRSGDGEQYDALIRPSEPLLASAERVIIIPDPALADVPYATLSDGKRPLIARMPVALAPNAGTLVREPARPRSSIVAVALPAGSSVALPETEGEIADVARLYPRATTVPVATFASVRDADADVIHIAGHTARSAGSDGAVLIFAGEERVSWSRLASMHLEHASIVTLAACETLHCDRRSDVRSLSLGGGFLAAGAHDVIGTLVPIADRDARAIFCRIHRRLAAGVEAGQAVREAQLEDLAAGGSAWRAIAILTNRIPV